MLLMTTRSRRWLAGIGAGGTLVLLGCTAPQRGPGTGMALESPTLHAVQARRLREIMAELDRLLSDRLPQELDVESTRALRLEEIRATADSLASAADDIPSALKDVRISEADAAYFRELAGRLEVEARTLGERAARGELHSPEAELDRMLTTCDACHTAFRIMPAARSERSR